MIMIAVMVRRFIHTEYLIAKNRLVEELNSDKFNFHHAKVTAVTLNHSTCNYLGGYVE